MDMYDLLLAKKLGGGGGGGGGGSVVMEKGTWTPTSDTNGTLKVYFADPHDTTPAIVMLTDNADTDRTYCGRWFLYLDNEILASMGGTDLLTISNDGTDKLYGIVRSAYNQSNNVASNAGRFIKRLHGSAGDDTARDTYVTNEWFCPYTYQNSSPFKGGRSYKWVAIWL